MKAQARILALSFALIAMTLRALVPAGWMPDTGTNILTLCTIEGLVHVAVDQDGNPAKPAQDHQPCAFGAAASLALTDAPAITFSLNVAIHAQDRPRSLDVPRHGGHAQQSPRAPPQFS